MDNVIKIYTAVDKNDHERLKNIQEKYGFKSVYQMLNIVVCSFLRVADPANDKSDDILEDEIKAMFSEFSDWEDGNIDPRKANERLGDDKLLYQKSAR